MEICLDNYSCTTIVILSWLLLISTNTTDSYLDTHINQSLCCAANIPRLETVVPGFQQQYGHRPDTCTDRAIVVTPSTHYTLTNYRQGMGSHIQTNRWQFSYKKLSQFYSEIKFLQFYCTLYIVTIFHTQLSVICVVVQQLSY